VRFVVLGAGAVGGVVGGRLAQAGHDVLAVARGAHGEALRDRGLTLRSPHGSDQVPIPVVEDVRDAGLTGGDDVLLLAVKSQQTAEALGAVLDAVSDAGHGPPPVVCLQNGIDNERAASRWFPEVYGSCVLLPATHLEPGVVHAHWAPTTGSLDVGRYPDGVDDRADAVTGAFRSAGFGARGVPDIMRWKHGKLIMNLVNAAEALCGPQARGGPVGELLRDEGMACLRAAARSWATAGELAERRRALGPIDDDGTGAGGSSWQSLARGAGSVETDYLNGEIVLLGRQCGFRTPANELVQRLAREQVRSGAAPGTITEESLLRRLMEVTPDAGRSPSG
jgi:2-dehydropantoate 2-reductase